MFIRLLLVVFITLFEISTADNGIGSSRRRSMLKLILKYLFI
jgi:hypothetical protein